MTRRFLHVFVFLCIASVPCFAFQAYEFAHVGGAANGVGFAGTAYSDYPEGVLYNPALLATMRQNEIFYEAEAALRIRAITKWDDYRVEFDGVGFLGALYRLPKAPVAFALTFSTIANATPRTLNGYYLRQLGGTVSWAVNDRFSLGVTAGFLFASDRSYDTARTFSWSAALGARYAVSDAWTAALSFTLPIWLSWNNYQGSSKEDTLPLVARWGNMISLTSNWTLFADLEFQAWGMAKERFGGGEYVLADVGLIGETLHPHIGVEYYDRAGRVAGAAFAGGVYRLGVTSFASTTSAGNLVGRAGITLGATVYAADYFRFNVSFVDTALLSVAGNFIGERFNIPEFIGMEILEQIRVTVEMDFDIFSGKKPPVIEEREMATIDESETATIEEINIDL